MSAVLCLGELLVDWVCTEVGNELDQAQSFTKAPGGAPANVAVGLARQGVPSSFLGGIANDKFGYWLKSVLEQDGVDTSGAVVDSDVQTRMAYVVTCANGDRKLAEFSKINCADMAIKPTDLRPDMFKAASVLHFGSISLIASPAAEATAKAVELAKENNMLISYDPNVRLGLWPSPEACKHKIMSTLSWADLVKINEDELEFLTGSRNLEAAEKLREQHNIALLIITLDSRGAALITPSGTKTVNGFKVNLVEATGAGDGFVSAVIGGLLPHIQNAPNRREALLKLLLSELCNIVLRANAVGALTCTKKGAIPALPTKAEIDKFMASALVSS